MHEPDTPDRDYSVEPVVPSEHFNQMTHDLGRDLTDVWRTLPASLDAIVAGDDGIISIPPEQVLEGKMRTLEVISRYIQGIAAAGSMAVSQAEALEKRVAALEDRLKES